MHIILKKCMYISAYHMVQCINSASTRACATRLICKWKALMTNVYSINFIFVRVSLLAKYVLISTHILLTVPSTSPIPPHHQTMRITSIAKPWRCWLPEIGWMDVWMDSDGWISSTENKNFNVSFVVLHAFVHWPLYTYNMWFACGAWFGAFLFP